MIVWRCNSDFSLLWHHEAFLTPLLASLGYISLSSGGGPKALVQVMNRMTRMGWLSNKVRPVYETSNPYPSRDVGADHKRGPGTGSILNNALRSHLATVHHEAGRPAGRMLAISPPWQALLLEYSVYASKMLTHHDAGGSCLSNF